VSPPALYVESSALIAAILDGDPGARAQLDRADALVASELTFLEAARALIRARRLGAIDAARSRELARQLAAAERECDLVAIDEEVLRVAREELPVEPVRTLDAIHLATIRVVDEQLGGLAAVASYDRRVRANVDALGIPLLDDRPGTR
jgi:predicted nucleic acid-binding protein